MSLGSVGGRPLVHPLILTMKRLLPGIGHVFLLLPLLAICQIITRWCFALGYGLHVGQGLCLQRHIRHLCGCGALRVSRFNQQLGPGRQTRHGGGLDVRADSRHSA